MSKKLIYVQVTISECGMNRRVETQVDSTWEGGEPVNFKDYLTAAEQSANSLCRIAEEEVNRQ